ncbi:MAG: ABC transporter substrate-binding protein [Armatimonadota bacterium]|nr:ABC transporter substrate-binding protein [Armatimonadota bacterium]MDR7533754.1 ABC transporter substrate-binding protein [Armatimonadota bacterium]MDR7535039.1 ABC transporter substrate-binding protein [Armatimonadota bacterium]
MRIVSLLPSATEIACALGLRDRLVGVSHDCDWPPDVRGLPVLAQAVVTAAWPSAEIDAAIRRTLHAGTSVYHLDAAQLAALAPDLILTQELCQVCAPSFPEVRQAARVLAGAPQIVSLEPHGLDDILETILEVGRRAGADDAAGALVAALRGRIDRVRRLPPPVPQPRVVCLEWLDPLFVAGHWVPEMVEIAGGVDVLGHARRDSCVVDWEQVREAAPDVVVIMPCGFDMARTRSEQHLLTGRPGWDGLPAVRAGRVYLTDASAYFNRPGPRIVRGLEILAELLRAPAGPFHTEGAASL